MDAELWAARLAAAKRQHSLHHSQSQFDRLSVDGFEVEEDVRPDFSCPYCYEDYDIASLCSHLEDEHPYESKLAICPVCNTKVGRDMLNHITAQHGHLFKIQRRRRLRRVAVPHGSTLSLLSRELREAHLQVLLGGGSFRSTNNSSSTVADSLFSSLAFNFPGSEAEEIAKSATSTVEDTSAKVKTTSQQWKACNEPSLSSEERAQKIKQATLRANFVQQLVVSTLLGDE
uniref:Drought induced 19 protein type zinc-binding domain-containing protein n=1 Tax=Araucaria cunninghamii TaxID=56994 RepID=A0A0D6R7I4_ARACU